MVPAGAAEHVGLYRHGHERPGENGSREPAPAQAPALSLGQP
jgi:hypothetical protein